MNSLIKKGIPVILVLLLMAAVFSGCGAKPIAAPMPTPASRMAQNSSLQPLSTDDTTSENTEQETPEQETTESGEKGPLEAFIPESVLSNPFVQKLLAFFDWWTTQVNNFFDLIKTV